MSPEDIEQLADSYRERYAGIETEAWAQDAARRSPPESGTAS